MGGATALVGVLPTYAQIGILAPIILVTLRLVQGLALGGEYGGAAIYVAEHAPDHQRGKYTSWIQTTATVGLLLALAVILFFRLTMGDAAFKEYGWRIPFILSAVLVVLALAIRLRLQETPLFSRLKAEGRSTTSPWRESFGDPKNRRLILLALVRDDRRSGRRLVPGPVPGAVLHAEHPRREVQQRLLHRRHGDRARDAVLPLLRAPVGQDRAEADHPRRLPDRGAHLLPDLQPDVHGRESRSPNPKTDPASHVDLHQRRIRTSRC